jgi:predicted XRE-type DNA-binding protein
MAKRLNNNNYQYPERDKEIIVKISNPNYEVGNYILPENSSIEDKFKYEICQTILTYQQENKIAYRELAQQLELPFAEAMALLKKRINHFTLTDLVNYLEKLTIPCQVKIIPTQLKSETVPRFKR